MAQSIIDAARIALAPMPDRCIILGGESVRLAFMSQDEGGRLPVVVAAVTLTRTQLEELAGMISSVLDCEDLEAVCIS